jgi:integrase/recombinase XerD
MMLLTHWICLRIVEVAELRCSDVISHEGLVKDEIRRLAHMTKGRHAHTVFVNTKLKRALQDYADSARCVDRD